MNNQKSFDNASLSIGTESLNSVTSNYQIGGNPLKYLFGGNGDSQATTLIMSMLNSQEQDTVMSGCKAVLAAIANNVDIDCGKLVYKMVQVCKCMDTLRSVIRQCKSCVNYTDPESGNTSAHIALNMGRPDIVDLLKQCGADLTIENKAGVSIVEDAPAQPATTPAASVFAQRDVTTGGSVDKIANIVGGFVARSDNMSDTIGFTRSETAGQSHKQFGGNVQTSQSDSVSILHQLLNEIQTGGKAQSGKSVQTGRRQLVTYSEFSVGAASDTETAYDLSELADVLNGGNKESDRLHSIAIEKLMKNLNIDEDKARVYKAVIWNNIKQDIPESSNADKSIELDKRSSDISYLEKIKKSDLTKMTAIIEERRKERDSATPTNDKKTKSSKTTKSAKTTKKSKKDTESETELSSISL